MSNRDQLPNWAGRSVGPPNQQPTQPPGEHPNQPPNQQSRQAAQQRERQPLASREGRQPTPAPNQGQRQPQANPLGQPPQLVPVNQQRPIQQMAQQPFANQPNKKSKKGGRTALIVLGAIALFAVFGAGGYYVGTIGRGETTTGADAATTSAPAAPTSQAAADSASGLDGETTDSNAVDSNAVDSTAVDSSSGTTEDEAMDDASTGTEPGDDSEVVTVPGDQDNSNPNGGVAPRRATLRNGMVYLEGTMPTREIADLAVGKAAAVVGPDRVVDEYVIDPSVPFDPAEKAPIYVEEVVLFEFNSDQIAEPFKPLLDLGVSLMIQNPQGTLTVTTHTDAVGSEEINLEVATDRAESIKRYMTSKGVPESQIVLDPRGEEDASEVDDESVAAQQRRAEFLVENILE